MKTVRILLYVISALFMLSVVGVFLPWDWLNALMGWFGPFAYPDDPMVQYSVKIMLAVFFWIGILMVAAVTRAESDPLFLLIFGLTYLSLAAVVAALVPVYQLPWLMYGDAASSVLTGVLFLVYRWQVTHRGVQPS